MERVIKQLEEKRNTFIGSLKDQITIAKTEGFRKGLDYAIEVLKIQIQQDELSERFATWRSGGLRNENIQFKTKH